MHSSQDAGHAQPSAPVAARAGNLSFPPTQRTGLPCSPASSGLRFTNQARNLDASCRALIDALSIEPLHHAEAL